ncbi:MAG: hypothetical protein H8D22_03915, partial [Candidatus Cloacimonetes bacterium]|nr:hypothetical protein [Candidatus Cloacimonadota bacterium]
FDGGSWARVIDCCDEFLGSGGFHNNMTYISDNNELTVLYEPEPTYIFTPITTGEIILNEFMEPYYTMTYAYADECEYEIYRFSQHLNFVFENITLSDILKELCITQDIVWYLDYTTNGITVTFTDRKDTANWSLLGESDMGSISTKVVKIKFDDLKSQIFPASKERMEDLIGYYNDRYGQGKHKKEIEMFGYQDKDLGNIIKYNSKYWMVEDIEWSIDRIKERTNITMFEIGDI